MITLQVAGVPSSVQVHARPQVTNIVLDGGETSYNFDAAGRLIGAFVGQRNYQRGLDNRVLTKWRAEGERQRRWLDEAEAGAFLESAYDLARRVYQQMVEASPRSAADWDAARRALAIIAAWDFTALQVDRERFLRVYHPVSILPPDQYLALVLQATEGCSHNACTFCAFYRGRPFRIKSLGEFREHIAQVREFLGPSLRLRKSIFLADANALVIPQARLVALLDAVNGEFFIGRATPDHPGYAGIYSFIDAFHVEQKSVAEWAALAERGLRRAYIGMETGDDNLLRFLNKPSTRADVAKAITRLKAAGVAVSVIILIGIGGDRYAEGHEQGTIAALNTMPLSAGDLIYFSDFMELAEAEYGERARGAGIRLLSKDEMRAQEQAIRSGLRWVNPTHPPQISRYDIREFVY